MWGKGGGREEKELLLTAGGNVNKTNQYGGSFKN
jgi:hypothetical protein